MFCIFSGLKSILKQNKNKNFFKSFFTLHLRLPLPVSPLSFHPLCPLTGPPLAVLPVLWLDLDPLQKAICPLWSLTKVSSLSPLVIVSYLIWKGPRKDPQNTALWQWPFFSHRNQCCVDSHLLFVTMKKKHQAVELKWNSTMYKNKEVISQIVFL